MCSFFVWKSLEKFDLLFFFFKLLQEQDLWVGPHSGLALLCYQRHLLSQILGKWRHPWAVSATALGYIPLTSRVHARALKKKKHKMEGCCGRSRSTWWSTRQWSMVPHKSSSIVSDGRKGWVAPRPSPSPLIHMSIRPLSMPLSKDYWCPAFDLWHIMCYNVSANEVTQSIRGRVKPNRRLFWQFVRANAVVVGIMASPLTSTGLIHQSCR